MLLIFIILTVSGISSYESLLNNVPPNVSLQRSSNAAPDSQLSPGFNQNMIQQQLSPSQRGAPFSPQSNSGKPQEICLVFNQQIVTTFRSKGFPTFGNTGQTRLSPQQQQIAFQSGTNNAISNSQLSPRQPPQQFSQGIQQQQQNSPVQPNQPQQQQQSWNNAATNPRINLQQHNPLLNAQLVCL